MKPKIATGTPLALMSGMNVFGTNIPANNDPQKINYQLDLSKVGLNIGGSAGFDKVTFDSLLTNLKADTIERRRSDQKDYYAEQTKRNQEYSDRNNLVDNRSEDRRSEKSYRATEKSDRNVDAGNREKSYRAETVKQNNDLSDGKAELEGNERNVDSAVINKDTKQTDDDNQKENGESNALKIGSVLFDIAGSKAGELTNAGETVEGEETALTGADKEAGQGLKNGSLLNELLQGKSAGAVGDNTNNGKDAQGLAGVKAGDILKSLIDAKTAEAGKPQVDTAIKNEGLEAINTEALKTENGLKAGELLNKSSDAKTEGIEKELMNAQAKADNAQGEDADTEIDELIRKLDKNIPADKKAEIKQEQIKEHRIQDFMNQKDIQEGNNAKAAVSKDMPGMVENLLRESGARPNVNTAANSKTASESSDTNNINMLSDVSAKSGGLKVSIASPTGTIAKPSGFADVVNKIVYVAKGDTKLGVTVEHKDLGQLNIKLSLEKGVVNVHINTADKAAREFVESNIQQIVDSLSKNGVSVGGFSVGLKNQQQHDGFGNNSSNKNNKAFSIDGIEQREYSKAASNVYNNNGRVSVFA